MKTEAIHTAILIPLSKASKHPYSFQNNSRSENTVSVHKENVNRTALDISDKEKEHSFRIDPVYPGKTVL
jgi:anaerobic glycerol-3-phosphate dehydrogenase